MSSPRIKTQEDYKKFELLLFQYWQFNKGLTAVQLLEGAKDIVQQEWASWGRVK